MESPNIQITNHSNRLIKTTNDVDVAITFSTDNPQVEYDIWTDWQTSIFHSVAPSEIEEGMYHATLHADTTGFYTAVIRYKNDREEWVESEASLDIHVDPEWIDETIVYNIFIRAFGAKEPIPGEGGTFEDVLKHMDRLVDLGVNAIYLNPFHLIGELYRKYNPNDHLPHYLQPGSPYSIKDPKSIDPEVAFSQTDVTQLLRDPKNQFKKLVDAAHKRGMRVIMDLVFNHTSHDFVLQRLYPEWFLYKEDITSADSPYLYPEDVKDGKPWGDAKNTVVPFDHGEFGWTDVAQLHWEFRSPPAPNMPPPNTKKKEMYEYFKSVPKYWIQEFGIDGFRCDVAYRVPKDFWKACISEARAFAKEAFPHNRSIDGEIIFIAESYVDDLDTLYEAGFSLAYGDYSNKIYTPMTLKGYLDYMYNIGTNDFPEGTKWFIFPECHDFHRATSKLVPLHDSESEAAMRGNMSRWVLTATLPGVPMIFNGFENVEWHQVQHVSYSRIDLESTKDIRPYLAKINNIRKNFGSLQKGEYRFIENEGGLTDGSKIFAFVRYTADEVMIIAVNMDIYNEAGTTLQLPKVAHFDPDKPFILKDLFTNTIFQRTQGGLPVVLGPGESHIFLVEQNWGD